LALFLLLDVALDPVRGLVATRLGAAVDAVVAQTTIEGAMRPAGIEHLDDPRVADQIETARAVGLGALLPGHAVSALANLLGVRLSGLASAALLGWVAQWWMAVALGAAWSVVTWRQERGVREAVTAHGGEATALRRAAYLRDVAIGPSAAKEVRLFGLQSWLVTQFARAWWDGMVQLRRAQAGWRRHVVGLLLLAVVHLAVLGTLAQSAGRGELPVGQLAVALSAVLAVSVLGWAGDEMWLLHTASAAVPASVAVGKLGTGGLATVPARRLDAEGLPRREIRFEQVGFRYPGDQRPVLDGLDLTIAAGTSLAIVGDNGAGKSTVAKLLAALYQPERGRITIDGHDLANLETVAWRRQLAVVFQDFMRYPLSVRDNIGFGRIEVDASDEALAAAAQDGGFAASTTWPLGWDTPLSGAYTDGTDLSGGQWQRLALARALYAVRHGARVLVLDEPTAHLDVRAEHDLYARFLALTAGITTILVSHRFATVRLADRIAVLRDGRVSEYGTHEQLLEAGGRYAALFAVQSRQFVEPAENSGVR
jgi:ATP-binding cassette subfamily B protein